MPGSLSDIGTLAFQAFIVQNTMYFSPTSNVFFKVIYPFSKSWCGLHKYFRIIELINMLTRVKCMIHSSLSGTSPAPPIPSHTSTCMSSHGWHTLVRVSYRMMSSILNMG